MHGCGEDGGARPDGRKGRTAHQCVCVEMSVVAHHSANGPHDLTRKQYILVALVDDEAHPPLLCTLKHQRVRVDRHLGVLFVLDDLRSDSTDKKLSITRLSLSRNFFDLSVYLGLQ